MQMEENLLEQIVRKKDDLRKSDKRVAEFILMRAQDAVDMTLSELAASSDVSEPTVIRFCNATGCEGFRDFRTKLARSLAFARSTSHTAISDDDDLTSIITKMFDYNLSNLNWAKSNLDTVEIKKAIELLLEAKRIEFFGFGASGIVALDAQQKFPLFGVPCGAPLDAHQMFMTAEMLNHGDVVVSISNTGHSMQIVRATEIAKRRGANTIGITGRHQSPLIQFCDIVLVLETLENTDVYTPTVSRLSHLVLIDILSTAVSLQKGKNHHNRIVEMKVGLSRFRSTDV